MPEIEVSRSPGNEFLGNSFSAFRAVVIERRERIPRKSVLDRASKKFKLFLSNFATLAAKLLILPSTIFYTFMISNALHEAKIVFKP